MRESAAKRTTTTDPAVRTGLFAKHPRAWLAGALGLAFVLLGSGAVAAGIAVGSGAAPNEGPSSAVSTARPVPTEMPVASRLRTCSIAAAATDPRLLAFSGAVVNASTGELLFDRGAKTPVPQGSVLKVLTAAAALNILGPDYQIATRVYEGSTPGTVVLVGTGDPTLSQLPAGSESVYAGAPKLDDLAAQVLEKYDDPITTIILDTSYWAGGDEWDSTWKRSEQTQGYLSEVAPLQIDGDRSDPQSQKSPRSTEPIARAGNLFAESLGLDADAIIFSSGTAVTTKPLLGEVRSQPIKVLVNQMLVASDATLAETMARVVSKQMGLGGSAASLPQAITSALGLYGVDTTGVTIRDGSGFSTANSVPPGFMAAFMIAVMQGGLNLNLIYDSLAVSGKSGVLSNRFTGDSAVPKGAVIAKTGYLDTEYSMAGIINAADGTKLAFAFYAVGAGIKDTAKPALDALAAGSYTCGDNLSNN